MKQMIFSRLKIRFTALTPHLLSVAVQQKHIALLLSGAGTLDQLSYSQNVYFSSNIKETQDYGHCTYIGAI